MILRTALLGGLIVLTAAGVAGAADWPTFTIQPLDTLGGADSEAWAINNRGLIAGWADNAVNQERAAIWSNGVPFSLGTLGGSRSQCRDINEAGHASGLAYDSSGSWRAFLYKNGVMSNLDTSGGVQSFAIGMNDSDEVVGAVTVPVGFSLQNQATLWQDGSTIDLGVIPPGTSSTAYDINNHTQVVGQAQQFVPQSVFRPFFWQDTNGNAQSDSGEMVGYPFSTGRDGIGWKINDREVVAGFQDATQNSTNLPRLAYTRKGDEVRALGRLPFFDSLEAFAINESGVVVGNVFTKTNKVLSIEPFIYANGRITNLNALLPPASGWTLKEARDVNDAGQIVGYGVVSGATRGFVMSPASIEIEVQQFDRVGNQGTQEIEVAWSGFGTGVVHTLEQTTALPAGAWISVPPTSQWPQAAFFWRGTVDATQVQFRVRTTYGSP